MTHRRHGSHHHGPRAHGGRLFWRVYRHGLLLLLLVALTVAGVGWVLRAGDWSSLHRGVRAAAYAAARVEALSGDPAALETELASVRDAFGLDASVYDRRGALLATSVRPALDPATGPSRDGGPARLRGRRFGWAVPLAGGGVLAVAPPAHGPEPMRGLAFIGAVLAVLALGSIPLARSIAAPVEAVTAAARRLGRGDLSARANVRARGEVGELGRSFDDMAERLERLVRAERELLANVSHELRTPLTRIRVALELAAEGDPERARRHLAGIAGDLDELDRLVADVLAAARLDAAGAGGLGGARAPVDPAALAEEAARRFEEGHPGRTLVREVAAGLPSLLGDAALLRRLLANLLDNAAKYSEAPAPVTLAARAEGDALVVEVRDQGIGIDAADLPRLFTPFFRTDRSRARGTGGVGLGLVLARRIAEAHGGTIAVASEPGKGTTVTVRLPPAGPRESGSER